MATDELARGRAPANSTGSSFRIWPPPQCAREWMVQRLVDAFTTDSIFCKRHGAVPAADAEHAARAIEAEAFDAAADTGRAAVSVQERIEAQQFYGKEVRRLFMDFVKSRSAASKAQTPSADNPPAAEVEAAESQATA